MTLEMNRVCLVCFKAPDRPMIRFVNKDGLAIYIHEHHRVMTIFGKGIEMKLTKAKRSRSKRAFVSELHAGGPA